ncbi:MAG: hypothetical protein ABL966_06600 [Acidimicrobiales bacterium]
MRPEDRRALGLAAFIGGAGVMHFVRPEFFDAIVPDWMPGDVRTTTYVSGVAELTAAVLVANPRTRRIGGWFAFCTFLGVFPANIQSALDGGIADAPAPFDSAAAAWLRLPLQLPMLWWARRVAKDARPLS